MCSQGNGFQCNSFKPVLLYEALCYLRFENSRWYWVHSDLVWSQFDGHQLLHLKSTMLYEAVNQHKKKNILACIIIHLTLHQTAAKVEWMRPLGTSDNAKSNILKAKATKNHSQQTEVCEAFHHICKVGGNYPWALFLRTTAQYIYPQYVGPFCIFTCFQHI